MKILRTQNDTIVPLSLLGLHSATYTNEIIVAKPSPKPNINLPTIKYGMLGANAIMTLPPNKNAFPTIIESFLPILFAN